MARLSRPQPLAHTDQLSPELAAVFGAIPVNDFFDDRWDREWLLYFLTENPKPFIVGQEYLDTNGSLVGATPEQVFGRNLVTVRQVDGLSTLGPLAVWVSGDDLTDKHVLEIGCGPGLLGKQIGMIARSYVGLDYSRLALSIARLTSTANCRYYHLSEALRISEHAGTVDTMVGRHFFIHQNYQNARWLLELAALLLKPGGLVSADFYLRNPAEPQGVVRNAKKTLNRWYASCAFEFSTDDVRQLAADSGLAVDTICDRVLLQRRFVWFRKPLQPD